LRRCRFHLPLRRNCRSVAIGSNCRSAVIGGQPISVLVTSSLCNMYTDYGKTFPAFPFSHATATVATERKNGNGMVKTRHKSVCLSVSAWYHVKTRSRAVAGKTARCCTFRSYVSNFTTASRGFSATARPSCIVPH